MRGEGEGELTDMKWRRSRSPRSSSPSTETLGPGPGEGRGGGEEKRRQKREGREGGGVLEEDAADRDEAYGFVSASGCSMYFLFFSIWLIRWDYFGGTG